MSLAIAHGEYLLPGLLGLFALTIITLIVLVWGVLKFWRDRKKK